MSSIPSSSKTSSRPADAFGSQQTVDNAVHHTALLAQRDGNIVYRVKCVLPNAIDPDMCRDQYFWHTLLNKGPGAVTDSEWDSDDHGPKLVNVVRMRVDARLNREADSTLLTAAPLPTILIKQEAEDEDAVLEDIRRAETGERRHAADTTALTTRDVENEPVEERDADEVEHTADHLNPLTINQAPARRSMMATICRTLLIILALAAIASLALTYSRTPPADLGTSQDPPSSPPPIETLVPLQSNISATRAPAEDSYQSSPVHTPIVEAEVASEPPSLATQQNSNVFHLEASGSNRNGEDAIAQEDPSPCTTDDQGICLLHRHQLIMGDVQSIATVFDFTADWPPSMPFQWNPFYPILRPFIPSPYVDVLMMFGTEAICYTAVILSLVSPSLASSMQQAPALIREFAWVVPRVVVILGLVMRVVLCVWFYNFVAIAAILESFPRFVRR